MRKTKSRVIGGLRSAITEGKKRETMMAELHVAKAVERGEPIRNPRTSKGKTLFKKRDIRKALKKLSASS